MNAAAQPVSTANEYLRRFVGELGGPFPFTVPFDEQRFKQEIAAMRRRPEFVTRYAWGIPSDEAIDLLASLAPIVEVGAGGGYWAMLLRDRGADVVAYDADPGTQPAPYAARMIPRRLWTDVGVAEAAVAGRHPDRSLFLCWPPYDTPMAHDALKAYLGAGGETVVYVGEGQGGCNATDPFFELLEERMVEDEDLRAWIPRWPGMHDHLTVYRRRA